MVAGTQASGAQSRRYQYDAADQASYAGNEEGHRPGE